MWMYAKAAATYRDNTVITGNAKHLFRGRVNEDLNYAFWIYCLSSGERKVWLSIVFMNLSALLRKISTL